MTLPHEVSDPEKRFVHLERVTKRYGTQVAVDDLSLDIQRGEFLSLLGPSGCGKTTTLRMIAGFEEPNAGRIEIDGVSVIGTPPYRRNVNTVFQAYALFPHMSVAENVAYGLQQKRTPKAEMRERVENVLDMVQMRQFADRKPTLLSGGQQQRVALARALVNRPSVLLLDEPLAALDRKLREEMQLELKLIQAKLGLTFVFVTHDQGEALSMSDRIAVMRKGSIEQLGDSDTVYGRPNSAFVASFVGQQNFFDGTVNHSGVAVDTANGAVAPAQPITELAPGETARAAVRPEFIRVQADEPTRAENAMQGRVIGVSHLGEIQQFLIQVNPEFSIISRIPTHEAPSVTRNQTVWCSWDATHVHVFPAEETLEMHTPTTTAIKTA